MSTGGFDQAAWSPCIYNTLIEVSYFSLSSSDAALLRLELDQLSSAGFQWAHPYTQCVLQNTITAILNE